MSGKVEQIMDMYETDKAKARLKYIANENLSKEEVEEFYEKIRQSTGDLKKIVVENQTGNPKTAKWFEWIVRILVLIASLLGISIS